MKILLSILLSIAMFANEVQINESNPEIVTVQEQQVAQDDGNGITATDVLAVIAMPVYVAGAIVTAIVVAPIWLVKKIFE